MIQFLANIPIPVQVAALAALFALTEVVAWWVKADNEKMYCKMRELEEMR